MKFLYEYTGGVSTDELKISASSLDEYREHLNSVVRSSGYTEPESSINLPSDESILKKATDVALIKRGVHLKYVIVVGIGGSNLGTKAIYDALYGHFDGLEPDRYPRMIFIDTNNTEYLNRLLAFLDRKVSSSEDVLINIISKSGETTETVANAEILVGFLQKKFSDIKERIVVTTSKDSSLWKEVEDEFVTTLSIPEIVGGRYSVFSAVGIFPLLSTGLDVASLLKGAEEMRERCLSEYPNNPAVISACLLKENLANGKVINDNFVFNDELESLGKWYRQLMGESIGKECGQDGSKVETGITPTVSVGSTDLHSMGQLYLGGPKDKVTTFIRSTYGSLETPDPRLFPNVVPMLDGKTTGQIMDAIYKGTKIAYGKRGMPYTEIILPKINTRELGQLLQFKMMEIMYLGKLLNVNPFNQPNVESYKEETRKVLKAN